MTTEDAWSWPAVPPAAGSVRLRAFRDDDALAAQALSQDPYVPLIGTLPLRATGEQAQDWVAAQRQRLAQRVGFSFAVADRDDDACVGFAGLWLRQLGEGLATAGYAIVPAARGAGRATDALRALTAFAWTVPGVQRVELDVEPWNVASHRVAERAGFLALSTARHEIGGELREVVRHRLVRPPVADAEAVQRLRFNPRYLPAVRDGSKRVTMRFRDPVVVGPAALVFEFPDEVVLPGRVTATVQKTVAEVTEEEARAVGFPGREHVLPGLRSHYPDLVETDEIVLVGFDVDP